MKPPSLVYPGILTDHLDASPLSSDDECAWHWQMNAGESIKFVGRKRCPNERFCCGTCHNRYCCNDTTKRLLEQASCNDLFCGGFYYFKTSGVSSKHSLFKCNNSDRYLCSGSCQAPECALADSLTQARLDVDLCITSKLPGSSAFAPYS